MVEPLLFGQSGTVQASKPGHHNIQYTADPDNPDIHARLQNYSIMCELRATF